MWEPRPLTPLWAFTAYYRDSFTFLLYFMIQSILSYISDVKHADEEIWPLFFVFISCALCKELNVLNKFNIFYLYRGRYYKSVSGTLLAQDVRRKHCKVSPPVFVLGCVIMIMSFSLFGLRNKFEMSSTIARLNRIIWRHTTTINMPRVEFEPAVPLFWSRMWP
jgi:hypothetical protein